MAKADQFANIANNGIDDKKENLKEFVPKKIVPTYLKESSRDLEHVVERSYEQRLDEFYKDIKEMKKAYMPFLENFAPNMKQYRDVMELKEFNFRYAKEGDKKDFYSVLTGKGDFEEISLPDYKGPEGRWTGYYQKEITESIVLDENKRAYIRFLGVDYIAKLYWNHNFVGMHEGFFAPFEFDITDYYSPNGKNVLTIVVENDYTTLGKDCGNGRLDGDKIYAATGYGWNDAEDGWHHCPAGAGICNKVFLEVRDECFVSDIFVRPNIDDLTAEIWVEVTSSIIDNTEIELSSSIYGKNIKEFALENIEFQTEPAGPGVSYYKMTVDMKGAKLWSGTKPYLYLARVNLSRNGKCIDVAEEHFGMRKFHMDEEGELKGTLYLNNEEVILRGANTMGHMQQCVYKEDYDQLIEDILIAKYANMNFYRLTQRPVQKEIYNYCDALGMMVQTDMPLFGWLRRNKFCEAIKQAEEMERLVRCHPSNIMVTYINEPFPSSWGYRGHRSLLREELEDFFEAASKVIRINNPDRVIKNVDGDYDPPTRNGLSDFHCYNMWYTNHAIPIGKLHKGFLPATNAGWKIGCGEYGTEGLDPIEIMMEDYPKSWVPKNITDEWNPSEIVRAQSYTMHGDWYEEKNTIEDWINSSQKHQTIATKLMNDAFRRNTNVLLSTAVHLLIDAWPSGWMKTLVDYRRKPKPGYFAFKDTLEPVRINLRTDKMTVYADEKTEVECYWLNDLAKEYLDYKVVVNVTNGQKQVIDSFETTVNIKPCKAQYFGSVQFSVPKQEEKQSQIYVNATLFDKEGNAVNSETLKLNTVKKEQLTLEINVIGKDEALKEQFKQINIEIVENLEKPIYIHDANAFSQRREEVLEAIKKGGKAIVSLADINEFEIDGEKYSVKTIGGTGADGIDGKGLTFVARNKEHELLKDYDEHAFSYMYDQSLGYIGFITEVSIVGRLDSHLLHSYETPSFGVATTGVKEKIGVFGEVIYGEGTIYLSTVRMNELLGANPVLNNFFRSCLKEK